MIQTTIYCDKCGDRITQERTALKGTCGPFRRRDPIDLCSTCADALTEWLGPVPGRKPTEAAPAPTLFDLATKA